MATCKATLKKAERLVWVGNGHLEDQPVKQIAGLVFLPSATDPKGTDASLGISRTDRGEGSC